MKKSDSVIPADIIRSQIFLIRNKKVMFDKDLAALYGVETRVLVQNVKRNIKRFPEDFMFQLNEKEFINLISQFVISKRGGTRKLPFVFTEHGVAMLSSVLKSERAIEVNIQIMRAFSKFRELIYSHEDLKRKIELMERKYDKQFAVVFEAIKNLLTTRNQKSKKVGFHIE